MLLHTGHPNPGLSALIHRERASWRALGLPVIVHLLANDEHELERMGERIEMIEEVGAIEMDLSEATRVQVSSWTRAAARSQIPVIAQFPLGTSADLAAQAVQAGAAAVSVGPPRGSLPDPGGYLVEGRMYGPCLLPLALRTVEQWAVRVGAPVLGSGGVTTSRARQAMTDAGASGVVFDTILWTEPERTLD
jgi:dihydroorotate dehydrogenase